MSRPSHFRETRGTAKRREFELALAHMANQQQTPEWAQELLTKFSSVNDSFNQKFEELNASIKELRKDTRSMINRVNNAEKRIAQIEDKDAAYQKTLDELTKETNSLKTKVSYLESQSRRNNIVLVGLTEGVLEGADAEKELAMILNYILGRGEMDSAPEVDRHHRALRPRPGPSDPPRPYIVRLLRWGDRQLLLWAASKKKQMEWKGTTFRVFQDLPADIQLKRAEYGEIKRRLRAANIRYGMLFPARLLVTVDGQKRIYTSPAEAQKDLTQRLPTVFG
ncbi:hypothetical protein WMY93_032158 [Mugilogobius chulae]|uniref:L1 transposable element RRM domain-containing protein n=1 Tax=Mugilogobius chulae TaxID=88201 RepID=A0AAW0MCJ5_9GOBI